MRALPVADAYPIYRRGYRAPVARIREHLRRLENVLVAGRGGTFRYLNADQAIAMGQGVADRLLLGAGAADPDEVGAERSYGEALAPAVPTGSVR